MLGKCHLQLNERATAAEWFARALDLPASTVDDEQAITEARPHTHTHLHAHVSTPTSMRAWMVTLPWLA